MVNEKRLYPPEEVAEIAKAYSGMRISLALGSAVRENSLETDVKKYQTSVPNNVHNLLDVAGMFEVLNNGVYENEWKK